MLRIREMTWQSKCCSTFKFYKNWGFQREKM